MSRKIHRKLVEDSARSRHPPTLAPVPLPADAELLRPRFGGSIGLAANGSILERIRLAAQSRMLVELQYTAANGHSRSPLVERYSLLRSRAGDVSLAAHDVAAGHIKSYRVDRIREARVLEQPFVPRHAIELGPLSSLGHRASQNRAAASRVVVSAFKPSQADPTLR